MFLQPKLFHIVKLLQKNAISELLNILIYKSSLKIKLIFDGMRQRILGGTWQTQGRDLVWKIEWKNSQVNNDDPCLLIYLIYSLWNWPYVGEGWVQKPETRHSCSCCATDNDVTRLFLPSDKRYSSSWSELSFRFLWAGGWGRGSFSLPVSQMMFLFGLQTLSFKSC